LDCATISSSRAILTESDLRTALQLTTDTPELDMVDRTDLQDSLSIRILTYALREMV